MGLFQGTLIIIDSCFNSRNVLAGVIAFGIGCGSQTIPEVFASVQEALCFIDYDVKCKHGNEFIHDIDYTKHCSSWFDEQIQGLEKLAPKVTIARTYLKNIKSIAGKCVKIVVNKPDQKIEICPK